MPIISSQPEFYPRTKLRQLLLINQQMVNFSNYKMSEGSPVKLRVFYQIESCLFRSQWGGGQKLVKCRIYSTWNVVRSLQHFSTLSKAYGTGIFCWNIKYTPGKGGVCCKCLRGTLRKLFGKILKWLSRVMSHIQLVFFVEKWTVSSLLMVSLPFELVTVLQSDSWKVIWMFILEKGLHYFDTSILLLPSS